MLHLPINWGRHLNSLVKLLRCLFFSGGKGSTAPKTQTVKVAKPEKPKKNKKTDEEKPGNSNKIFSAYEYVNKPCICSRWPLLVAKWQKLLFQIRGFFHQNIKSPIYFMSNVLLLLIRNFTCHSFWRIISHLRYWFKCLFVLL